MAGGGGDIPYYIRYRERKTENGKRKTSIPPPSLRSSSPLSQGDIGNGKRNRRRKREQRKCIYSAEQQGGKDREAGLNRKNCATRQNKFLQGAQRYGERNYGNMTMCVCRGMRRGRVGGRGAGALHIGTSCAWSCGAIPSCRAMPQGFRQWRQAGAGWIRVCATFPFWLLVCQCRTRGRWRH